MFGLACLLLCLDVCFMCLKSNGWFALLVYWCVCCFFCWLCWCCVCCVGFLVVFVLRCVYPVLCVLCACWYYFVLLDVCFVLLCCFCFFVNVVFGLFVCVLCLDVSVVLCDVSYHAWFALCLRIKVFVFAGWFKFVCCCCRLFMSCYHMVCLFCVLVCN